VTSFQFTVPGQPVSWNAAFKTRMGQRGMFKTREAEDYQDTVSWIVKLSKKGWIVPEGRLIVAYEFFLKRDIDCDNLMKLLNDALARSLAVNDKLFMPVVISKTTGVPNPYTRVTVYDASTWRVLITE